MPKPLKRTQDANVYDFGKAVTLITSELKELNKTRNILVGDIEYFEARKEQEKQLLDGLLGEKTKAQEQKEELEARYEFLKGDLETRQQIIEDKEAKVADLVEKRQEIEAKSHEIDQKEQIIRLRATEMESEYRTFKVREADLVDKENLLNDREKKLASLAGDIEGQLVLLQTERDKNKSDIEGIKTMRVSLHKQKLDLEAKEIHLNDRLATNLTH